MNLAPIFTVLLAMLGLFSFLVVLHLPINTVTRRPATRRRSGNRPDTRARSRRRTPVKFLPGAFPELVRPDRNTSCTRCRGTILRGEDCRPTRNRRGLICPGCGIW
ncbi:hypothetical protein [Actinoplanes sp. NPDC026670]|uniref:hypothetical protein n=1 Tax=Actinoplanes sp. NPDC026670 TaxID=3154700 RepID=UPI0033FFB9CE